MVQIVKSKPIGSSNESNLFVIFNQIIRSNLDFLTVFYMLNF